MLSPRFSMISFSEQVRVRPRKKPNRMLQRMQYLFELSGKGGYDLRESQECSFFLSFPSMVVGNPGFSYFTFVTKSNKNSSLVCSFWILFPIYFWKFEKLLLRRQTVPNFYKNLIDKIEKLTKRRSKRIT